MKKLLSLIIVSLLLASVANAASIRYHGSGPWEWLEGEGQTEGWLGGALPGTDDTARANWADNTVTLDYVAPLINKFQLGVDESGGFQIQNGGILTTQSNATIGNNGGADVVGTLTVDAGGTVQVNDWLKIGNQATGQVTVTGTLSMTGHLWMGCHDTEVVTGTLDINGGTVIVDQNIGLGTVNAIDDRAGDGFINVNAGLLDLHHWNDTGSIQDGSVLDISFGKVVIGGDRVTAANDYAAAGKITGFGGLSSVYAVYDAGTNKTTITATDPLNHYPAMDQWDVPRPVTLSWDNIDSIPSGDPVWVDVWFGTDATWGQNESDPNIWEYTDFTRIVEAGEDLTSVEVSTLTDTTEGFYWQVNTYQHGDPAKGQYNYGDDPNLSDWAHSITEGLLMNFHTRNGPSCAGLADFNCSGIVALDDLSYIAGVWLTDDFVADIADPADNMVDVLDLSEVAQQWLDVSQEIAYWVLDETEGSVASDSSVNDYIGILVNMDDSDWVLGNTGNALEFDGEDDYVAIDGVFAELVGRDLTISAWVKAPAPNPVTQFIIAINTANGDGNKLLLGTQAGAATLSLGDTAWHHTTATIIDNTWHHIAFVLDDSTNIITVYVDGSFATNFTSTMSIATGDLLSFGQEYDTGMVTGDFYSGLLDEVKLYDRALSAAEIAILAQ